MHPQIESEYLNRLSQLTASKCRLERCDLSEGVEGVAVAAYSDVPDPEYSTMFSLGLSSVEHRAWRLGKPELVMTVTGSYVEWIAVMCEVVASFRGIKAFEIGSMFSFEGPLVSFSAMNALLVFVPTVLARKDQRIVLGDRTLNLVQLYPIYSSEIEVIAAVGAEAFVLDHWKQLLNVHRASFGVSPKGEGDSVCARPTLDEEREPDE